MTRRRRRAHPLTRGKIFNPTPLRAVEIKECIVCSLAARAAQRRSLPSTSLHSQPPRRLPARVASAPFSPPMRLHSAPPRTAASHPATHPHFTARRPPPPRGDLPSAARTGGGAARRMGGAGQKKALASAPPLRQHPFPVRILSWPPGAHNAARRDAAMPKRTPGRAGRGAHTRMRTPPQHRPTPVLQVEGTRERFPASVHCS